MPTILSKPQGWAKLNFNNLFLKNSNRKVTSPLNFKIMSASILAIILFLIKLRFTKHTTENVKVVQKKKQSVI